MTVLLQVPLQILSPYIGPILDSVDGLCHLAHAHGGHIPSSLPEHSRDYNLVQICHGAPGLLLMLAAVKSLPPGYVQASQSSRKDSSDALRTRTGQDAADAIWAEGLLKKGLGICHGVSGNGWALLTMAANATR